MEENQDTIALIEQTIDKIRPFLQRDGGDIDFIGFRDGIVYVAMTGACSGCMYAGADISSGVEIILQEEVPGVIAVKHEDIPEDLKQEYEAKQLAQYKAKQKALFGE
ncbi:MAG: NifU family protein [Bacillota bacterium]|nr:NifU family protein [Bacillota bacterium]